MGKCVILWTTHVHLYHMLLLLFCLSVAFVQGRQLAQLFVFMLH